MRILHTADWHLGRVFHRMSLLEEQRFALGQLTKLAASLQPDAIIVAGDIYDRAVPPAEATVLLDETLVTLVVDLGITTVVIAGNHDSPNRLGFGSRLLSQQALHVVGPLPEQVRPIVLHDDHGPVYLYALPYPDPVQVRRLLNVEVGDHRGAMRALVARVRAVHPPQLRSVLLTHAHVEGGTISESERPLSLQDEVTVPPACFDGFDYVALGHLHQPQRLGDDRIQYSGSIYPYSFAEADFPKSVSVVELGASGLERVERIPLVPRRRVRVIEGTVKELLEPGQPDHGTDDYLRVRVLDKGPVLGVVARLREVYPNLLEVDRPFVTEFAAPREIASLERQRGEVEQFAAFFEHVSGEPLPDELAQELRSVLGRLHSGDEIER